MRVEKKFAAALLLLIFSRGAYEQDVICSKSAFKHEGKCTACPDRCAACVAHQKCIECNNNYYGPVCQYTCPQDCEDLCHKERGYCTYGCADGRFPEPNSPRCPECPIQCKTCKSLTECFECNEGYFNQNGQCRRCPDGCGICYDSKSCSSCQEGYLMLTGGQCTMECPMASNASILEQTWHSTEDMMLQGCMDTTKGQLFVIKNSKPCIQYSTCSPNIVCPPEYEGKSACGTIKTYHCSHSCRQLNESYYRCEPNCTLIDENLPSLLLCLTNEKAFSTIKLSTESECFKISEGSPNATPQPRVVLIVVLISATVVVLVVVCLVSFRLMKGHHLLRKCLREDVDSIEPIGNEAITMVHKETVATVVTLRSQDLEIDETSYLNGDDSNDATVDNAKAEEEPMSFSTSVELIRVNPNQRSSYVNSFPYTRGSQSTVYVPSTCYFGSDVFTRLTPRPQLELYNIKPGAYG